MSCARNRLPFRVSWIHRRSGQLLYLLSHLPLSFFFFSKRREELVENQERLCPRANSDARSPLHGVCTRRNATRGPGHGRIRSAHGGQVSTPAHSWRRPGSAHASRTGTGPAASQGTSAPRPIKLKPAGGATAWRRGEPPPGARHVGSPAISR